MRPSGERAKNAHSINLPSALFGYHGNVLDKLKNKVKVHHLHLKCFHMVKRLWKSVQYIRRYSTKNASLLAVSYTWSSQMSSVISGVTQQKFTKFLHDIAISPLLSMCTFRQWYCYSFSNDSERMQVASVGVHGILPKSIDCHGNDPWDIGKRGKALSSPPKALSYGAWNVFNKWLCYRRGTARRACQ